MAKRVSSIYGNALFELAVEENKMDALLSEVQTLHQILLENADLLSLLNHPEVSKIEMVLYRCYRLYAVCCVVVSVLYCGKGQTKRHSKDF